MRCGKRIDVTAVKHTISWTLHAFTFGSRASKHLLLDVMIVGISSGSKVRLNFLEEFGLQVADADTK
jgi:hypothetical protein